MADLELLIVLVWCFAAFVLLLVGNDSEDDDDQGGGMMQPIYQDITS